MAADPDSRPPYWSLAGLAEGARLAAPIMPGMVAFGTTFGTVAAQKGLTLTEATLMSLLVFAGASQFVAVEMWADSLTLADVATIGLVTATVNMRFILMTAALRPWLGELPAWQSYPALFVVTDPGWLIAMRYRSEGGADASILLGGGLVLWMIWVASTVPGYLLGALVSDPKRLGLDLVLPCFFMVMLVPMWRGTRRAIPWAAAGATALAVAELVPGWWFIVAGAIAGSIAGGLLDERD